MINLMIQMIDLTLSPCEENSIRFGILQQNHKRGLPQKSLNICLERV